MQLQEVPILQPQNLSNTKIINITVPFPIFEVSYGDLVCIPGVVFNFFQGNLNDQIHNG